VRAEKDWAKSDDARGKLEAEGIAVNDTPNGTTWRRIPTTKR
jgi:cysteinyl-tRNA synthetase